MPQFHDIRDTDSQKKNVYFVRILSKEVTSLGAYGHALQAKTGIYQAHEQRLTMSTVNRVCDHMLLA